MMNDPNPWSNPATGGDNSGWGQPADPWSAPTTATPNPSPAPGEEAWRSAPPPTVEQPADPWAQASQPSAPGWDQAASAPSAAGWDQSAQVGANQGWDQPAPPAPADPWQQSAAGGFSQPAQSGWTDPAQQAPAMGWDTANQAAQPVNPYASSSPYPVVYAYDQPTVRRNGTAPLVLAVVALVVSLFLSWLCADGFRELSEITGTTDFDSSNLPPEATGASVKLVVGMFGQLVPSIIGVIAFILSIIAMKDPSARSKAVIGLIISIVAPILSLIVFFVLFARIPGLT